MNPHPGCRISRVRPKNSALAEIIIRKPASDADRVLAMAWARWLVNHHMEKIPSIAGFAMVVWDSARQTTAVAQCWKGGNMSISEVPDFARVALTSHVARRQALQVFADETGRAPPDDAS